MMMSMVCFFFFKQKTAYEMRISDWSSDVCSSDLILHDFQDFPHQLRIQGGRGLIEQHDLRFHGERARYGHTLLLSPRQMGWILFFDSWRQPDLVQIGAGAIGGFGPADFKHLHGGFDNIAKHVPVRPSIDVLEDQ